MTNPPSRSSSTVSRRTKLPNSIFFEYYLRWTPDAFSIGLQLGVRLLSGSGLRQ